MPTDESALMEGDDSEIEEEEQEEEPETRKLTRKFKSYKWPMMAALGIELLWCLALTSWREANQVHDDEWQLTNVHVGVAKDRLHVVDTIWVVFATFLVARIILVVLWLAHKTSIRDSTFAGLYMFFSTIQYPVYIFGYYVLYEIMTDVKAKPDVQVEAVQRTMAEVIKDSTAAGEGAFGMNWRDCLQQFSPTDCIGKVNTHMTCKMPFDQLLCSGWTWMGPAGNVTQCCIKNKYSLSRPSSKVPPTNYNMDVLSSLFTVLSTLAIWWAIKDNPMLPHWGDISTFTNGIWLDVMDAITFTQSYCANDKLLKPKFGIKSSGYAGFQDVWPWRKVMAIAILSMITTILAPIIYTICRRMNQNDSGGDANVDSAIADATASVRMLDADRAEQQMREAVKLQEQAYINQSKDKDGHISVMVTEEDANDAEMGKRPSFDGSPGRRLSFEDTRRPGIAKWVKGSHYDVKYTDKLEPSEEKGVPVARLTPLVEESMNAFGPHCCTGWCGPRYLSPQDEWERFEHRANFLDSVRSLCFTELPFLIWRWHMESSSLDMFSFAWVLMLKNFVWGAMDLMTILGCGSTTGTIFGHAPVQFLNNMVNGTSLGGMMLMGEGGIVLIGHQILQKAVKGHIQNKKDRLVVHRAWLIMERHRATSQGVDASSIRRYTTAIQHVEEMLAEVEKQESMRVM